jgi:hypothetical protein
MNTGRWRRTPAVIAPVPTQKASAFRPDANDDFGVTRPYPGALLERFADSDRRGDGEAFAVAEGHVELDHAKAPRGGIDGSVKPHQWPPRHGADNLHVRPSHRPAKPSSQRLEHCLLGGETAGQVLVATPLGGAVRDLGGSEQLVHGARMLSQEPLDAGGADEVDTDSE